MTASSENLIPLKHTAQNRCFGCGQANPLGLHLEFKLAEDGIVVCFANVADTYEGPRGYVHGGIIATLLDETMSKAVRARGVVAMTRHLEIDYLRPVPSSSSIKLRGKVARSEGRKHWVNAEILDHHDKVLAKGEGLFIEVRERREPLTLKGEVSPHG